MIRDRLLDQAEEYEYEARRGGWGLLMRLALRFMAAYLRLAARVFTERETDGTDRP